MTFHNNRDIIDDFWFLINFGLMPYSFVLGQNFSRQFIVQTNGLILAYLISYSGGPNLLKVISILTIYLKKYAVML